MNDDAVRLLGLVDGTMPIMPREGFAPGLEEIITRGIVHRGQVLVWANSVGSAEHALTIFPDLTGWECADSSFHIEDHVPVDVAVIDDAPVIDEAAQRTLLIHGLSFGLRFAQLVWALVEPGPVRCIIAANDTNATFRFHQIRPGERWGPADLDRYELDKVIVIDIEPGNTAVVPEPRLLYEPVLLSEDENGMVHQAGAFPTEAEAQKVLDIWRAEGRREPLAINLVPVYHSAEDWQADR